MISYARPNQTLINHLTGVAARAESFAGEFKNADWGRWLGMLHDLGKYNPDWQQYLAHNCDFDIGENAEDIGNLHPNHSAAGAIYATEKAKKVGLLAAYCIAGHHTGLPDYDHVIGTGGALSTRLQQRKDLSDALRGNPPDEVLSLKLPVSPPCGKNIQSEYCHLWIRMLFSCLVDADRLDSEVASTPEQSSRRIAYLPLPDLAAKFDVYMRHMQEQAPDTMVNRQRQVVLEMCYNKAVREPGFFSLTVPTGGGKTLSSIAFALNHALRHGKRRVIMAIPYTSIIEQTAQTYKGIFGDDNVLEHHCNLDPDKQTEWARLAAENWDAPLVVTTNVQLFESLFSAHPSSCRRIHNLAESVIILDEAQMLPPEYLKPILSGLRALVEDFGITVLLCTATQPALCGRIGNQFNGLEKVTEIIDNPTLLATSLKRVQIILPSDKDCRSEWADIALRLQQYEQVLCIVNTRRNCRELHALMPAGTVQLSALMCGEERSEIIQDIKNKLKNGTPVRVISTQLVESGVDIDFPVVFRALAGFDSIAQAAGRCNREGKLGSLGQVFAFNPPKSAPPGLLRKGEDACKEIIRNHHDVELSPEFYSLYFKTFFNKVNDFDQPQFEELLCRNAFEAKFQFRTFARNFKLIDNQAQQGIIVQYKHSIDLIGQLRRCGPERWLLRKLQRYTVNVSKKLCQKLIDRGMVEELFGIYIQSDPGLYCPKIGLLDDSVSWNEEMFMA